MQRCASQFAKIGEEILQNQQAQKITSLVHSDLVYNFKNKNGKNLTIKPLNGEDKDKNLYKYVLAKNFRAQACIRVLSNSPQRFSHCLRPESSSIRSLVPKEEESKHQTQSTMASSMDSSQ